MYNAYMTASAKPSISLFIPGHIFGGIERALINLAVEFKKKGYKTGLVTPFLSENTEKMLPLQEISLINLNSKKNIFSLFKLIRYLKKEDPDIFISGSPVFNLILLLAKFLSGSKTKIVIGIFGILSKAKDTDSGIYKLIPFLSKHLYKFADQIVACSQAAADDFYKISGLPHGKVKVIYTPIVTKDILKMSEEPVIHPWFIKGSPPVIIGVGRLTNEKNFIFLIRAFAELIKKRDSRLMIIGTGPERERLQNEISILGLNQKAQLAGFVDNNYAFIARSAVLVLTSLHDALPSVIIEALALGTNVVSVDCPGGVSEILERGRLGAIVPQGNTSALTNAILSSLDDPKDPEMLIMRAQDFRSDVIADQYLNMISSM